MAKKNFRKVQVGDTLLVRFNGSAVLGNEPYTLEALVSKVTEDRITTDHGDLYFFDRRWRYGASAEVATLLDIFKS